MQISGFRCTQCGHYEPLAKSTTKIWLNVCPQCGGQVKQVTQLSGLLSKSLRKVPSTVICPRCGASTYRSRGGKHICTKCGHKVGLFGKLFGRQEFSAKGESMNYVNLLPGEIVPKSDEYKCNVCMEGGMIDVALQGLIKKGKIKGFENLKGPEAVKLYKQMLKESPELRKGLKYPTEQQLKGGETIRFFKEGQNFNECPNCGPSTGWTLLELTHDIVRKYSARYMPTSKPWWKFW